MGNPRRKHSRRRERGVHVHGRQGGNSDRLRSGRWEYQKGNRKDGGGRQSGVGSSSAGDHGEKRKETEKEERGKGEKNRKREVVPEDERSIREKDVEGASGRSGTAGADRTDRGTS